jgi:AcrR family transcriptional regulator
VARPRAIDDERLLSATARAIGRSGPAFTVAEVAREAGVAAGTPIARFGSKRGMLLALARASTPRAVAAMAAAGARPGAAGVRAALVRAAEGLGDPGTAAGHLAQLGADLIDPELRDALRDHQRALRDEVARQVARAPDLPGAPPPVRAADALLALWNGALLAWSLEPRGSLAGRLRRDLDLLLDGWRAPPAAA